MENDPRDSVLFRIQTLYSVGTFAGLGDGELLERFATLDGAAAELAFAVLVERHGPMVVRVCRRILKNQDDTQDAFQATFLVLVRKGRTLRDRASVANWLYGVAFRVALDARAAAQRRQAHDRHYARERSQEVLSRRDDLDRADLTAVLDAELARLPGRYREPIVLCHLQGLTHEEAASKLGWPVGTVRSRLSRGREQLRSRLARRGFVITAAGLTERMAEELLASVPEALADLTVKAAIQFGSSPTTKAAPLIGDQVIPLAKGAIRAMVLAKFKTAALCLVVGGLLTSGMVGVAYEASLRDEHREVPTAKPPNQKGQASAPASKRVLNPLKGRAKIISILPDRTDVKKGQLICEFDPSELQDQLSDQAIQMTVAEGAYQNAQSMRELAELALREFKEGIYALELQGVVSEVGAARADLQIAQAEFDALKKDHKDSDLALMKAKRNLNRATFATEKATSKKMILEKFTYERKIKVLNLDIEKARADELNNKAKFESEKRKRRAIEDEIERCKIHAPEDGVVILGPGVQVGLSASEQQLLFRFVPADQPTRSR